MFCVLCVFTCESAGGCGGGGPESLLLAGGGGPDGGGGRGIGGGGIPKQNKHQTMIIDVFANLMRFYFYASLCMRILSCKPLINIS